MGTTKTRTMSPTHKAALATGRTQSAAVRRYLEAIDAGKPKRGRKRTLDSILSRLATIDATIDGQPAIVRLNLLQERRDLQTATASTDGDAVADAEPGFIEHAAGYSASKGITYGVWRESGVPADVLAKAGIAR